MRLVTHPKDIECFDEYAAPLMELIHSAHKVNINSTIPFFGVMLYFLIRELGCERVLEIGHAEGYTAFYMAHAVKDNGVRFGMKGNHYIGIDIVQTEKTGDMLKSAGLPATCLNMDSMTMKEDSFGEEKFDLIFQDGCHDTEHILYEMKTLYPKLKGEGKGYFLMHDVYGPGEEGGREVKKLIEAGVYKFEYVRLYTPYGLAIMRKMDGWDENKRHWTP
jgi:SAM-dependent methyltransferase